MKKFDLYPWHKMIDDLATSRLGFPYDLKQAMTRLGLSGPKQIPDQNQRDKLLAMLEELPQPLMPERHYHARLPGDKSRLSPQRSSRMRPPGTRAQ